MFKKIHLSNSQMNPAITASFLLLTIVFLIVTLSCKNGNLYNVESTLSEENNNLGLNVGLLDWKLGYEKFTVDTEGNSEISVQIAAAVDVAILAAKVFGLTESTSYKDPVELKNLCGLPLLCGSFLNYVGTCDDPCESLQSAGGAFVGLVGFALALLCVCLLAVGLDVLGMGIDSANTLVGYVMFLANLLNFVACMVFLGSLGTAVAGGEGDDKTRFYFLPGIPPTGLSPAAGAICQYLSLFTGLVAGALFRSTQVGGGGGGSKGGGGGGGGKKSRAPHSAGGVGKNVRKAQQKRGSSNYV